MHTFKVFALSLQKYGGKKKQKQKTQLEKIEIKIGLRSD